MPGRDRDGDPALTDAAVVVLALAGGAGALALWTDVRYPGLAPESLVRRVVALVVGAVVLDLATRLFERILASGAAETVRELGAFGVLLPALVFSLLTGIWLLRALQGAAALP